MSCIPRLPVPCLAPVSFFFFFFFFSFFLFLLFTLPTLCPHNPRPAWVCLSRKISCSTDLQGLAALPLDQRTGQWESGRLAERLAIFRNPHLSWKMAAVRIPTAPRVAKGNVLGNRPTTGRDCIRSTVASSRRCAHRHSPSLLVVTHTDPSRPYLNLPPRHCCLRLLSIRRSCIADHLRKKNQIGHRISSMPADPPQPTSAAVASPFRSLVVPSDRRLVHSSPRTPFTEAWRPIYLQIFADICKLASHSALL